MHKLKQATLITLQKSKLLLSELSNEKLCDKSIAPYYSSVGSHVRHILDFYDCILLSGNYFDLTARTRNLKVETCCLTANDYLEALIHRLENIDENILDRLVNVTDDLGVGLTEIRYTYSALLAQANSHTIHHYAIINYILNGLDVKIEDDTFGYNPTTPKIANLN